MTTAFQAITPCRELVLLHPCHPWDPCRLRRIFHLFLSLFGVPVCHIFNRFFFFFNPRRVDQEPPVCFDKEPFLGIRHSTFQRTQSDKSSPNGTRPSQPFATKHADMVSQSPHDEGILREAQLSYLSFQVQVQVQGTVVLLESNPLPRGRTVPSTSTKGTAFRSHCVLRTPYCTLRTLASPAPVGASSRRGPYGATQQGDDHALPAHVGIASLGQQSQAVRAVKAILQIDPPSAWGHLDGVSPCCPTKATNDGASALHG